MLPIISEFLDHYPEIDVKLVLADRLLDLLESDVDLALRIGELEDSSLVASRVGSVRRVTCARNSRRTCISMSASLSTIWRLPQRGGLPPLAAICWCRFIPDCR
jgi:DNA-binding transcriptional LysR family regulator